MSTVGLFVIERVLQVEFRDEVFKLRTAFRIIEVNGSAIVSREMTDDMHRIDKSIRRFNRFFDIKVDVK